MSQTSHEIEVNRPVNTVYNQWTQFEEFPRFMEGVEEVRQMGDDRLHWVASIGGQRKEWDARIVDQQPDQRIAWQAESGTRNDGVVTFSSLGPDQTRVSLDIDYEPEGMGETVGDWLGILSGRIQGDLERFKTFVEQQPQETGGWRGEISDRGREVA